MRTICRLALTLLLSVAWAQAQTESNQSSRTKSEPAATVQGCLQSSNGTYTLTDDSGKMYTLQGDTSKLAEHVGHEIQVTGAASTASSESSAKSPQDGTTSTNAEQHAIQVQDVKHIAPSCQSANK
jgi:hypothetical protein